MWFDKCDDDTLWADAARHLSKADPVLAKVIAGGPVRNGPRKDYFVALCRAIFAQQVNVKVVQVLFDRFRKLLPKGKLSPEAGPSEFFPMPKNTRVAASRVRRPAT